VKLTRHETREIEAIVDEELRFHVEMRTAELVRLGHSEADARAEALRRFGDMAATRAACLDSDRRRHRSHRRRELLHAIGSDALFALRRMRRRPLGFAIIIVTLAVGIGASTAVFSVAEQVLWRPLPVAGEGQVVTLWETDPHEGPAPLPVAPGNFERWRALQRSFSGLGLADPYAYDLNDSGRLESVSAWRVTGGFFAALGVRPHLGRLPAAEEYTRGPPSAVVLSYDYWRDRFGGDPSIVGRSIDLDGAPTPVVGVLPRGLDYPRSKVGLWAPWVQPESDRLDHTRRHAQVVARLRPGVSAAAAQTDMDRVAKLVAVELGPRVASGGIRVQSLREHIAGPVRPALLALFGAVGLLLLIGCSNATSLLLSDAMAREGELALRAAVGATAWRVALQLLSECAVYAAASLLLGVLLASWGIDAFVALGPEDLPRRELVALDWDALGFAAAASLISALLVGAAPAVRAARTDMASLLRAGHAVTPPRRLRRVLVGGQVALALVLLVGASLLGRSFAALRSNSPGFAPRGVVELQMFLYDSNRTPEARRSRVAQYVSAFEAMPGIERAGAVTAMPFQPTQIEAEDDLTIAGSDARPRRVYTTAASPGYFDTMGVPIVRGRPFDERRDSESAPRVALINEVMARALFAGRDPIGQRVLVGVMDRPELREIVGVVGDVRPTTLDSEPRPELYIPMRQSGTGQVTFVARTSGAPHAALAALRERVAALDRLQSIYHAAVVDDLIDATLVERRFVLLIAAALSCVALFLALIGVYGLMSAETRARTREIGIRVALGARPRQIATMVMESGLRAVLPGVVLGLAGAALLMQAIRSMLYRVAPIDPLTFLYIGVGTLAVVAIAAYLPARRASSIHPMEAIRRE
jgi:putative ABC transport system permease protein